jgi:hypothetical protein
MFFLEKLFKVFFCFKTLNCISVSFAAFLFCNQAFSVDNKIVSSIKKEKAKEEYLDSNKRAAWMAYPLRVKAQDRLDGLLVPDSSLPVFLTPIGEGDNFRPLVQLNLNFKRDGWSLYDGEKQKIKETSSKDIYKIYAFLNSRLSTVQVYALGPNDELEEEKIYIFSPEAREFKTKSIFHSLIVSSGYSYLRYRQFSFGTFITHSLFFGLNYQSPIKKSKFGYFGDFSSTLYSFDSSPVREPSHFLDARLGLTYSVKLFKNVRYRSHFRLGASSLNFFTFGRDFGFTGLFGPNLGFRTEYFVDGASSYMVNLSYAPYEFSRPLKERSLRFEVYKNLNLKNLRRARLGVEFSNSAFSFENESIEMNNLTLKFGMGL